MGRLGTRDAGEATRVAEAVAARGELRLAGAMTHFATSDDDPRLPRGAARGASRRGRARSRPRTPGSSSTRPTRAATLREPASHFDLVRCGIAVYGMDPFQEDPAAHGLEPALALVSYVAEVKDAEPGQSAGYGRRFVAERPTRLGTLPIGYGDGVRRGLTNNADVLVDGRRVPLVGTVSMDNITVDLGRRGVAPGAEAILIGAQGGERILAEEWARRLGTINYEVTCGISARVPRVPRADRRTRSTAARAALAGEPAWLVGGAVRDRLLGRATADLDVALAGDPRGGGARDRARGGRHGVRALGRVRGLARRRPRRAKR